MSNIAKLPTLTELVELSETDLKDNALMVLLNQDPPTDWVKDHPFIRGHKYISIGRVEYLLRRIFTKYKIEVLKTGLLLNTIEVTVRVWYQDPISHEMLYHDGVGACELQTQKDSGTLKLDMSNLNKGAVQMALPIAKSYAIKDACDHLGKLFGADLNRKEAIDYNSTLRRDPDDELEEIRTLYATATELTADEDSRIQYIINNKETKSYKKVLTILKSKQ